MSAVEKVEQTVLRFSAEEMEEFARWFDAFRAAQWDKQIEADVSAGKLDALASEALAEFRNGRTKPTP